MNKEIINLIVGVMGYSAEMELSNIRRRTEEGRAVAVSRGVKMGRKRSYSKHQIEEIQENDLLMLDELNRLGRTMVTMLVEVNKLLEKGIKIRTLDGRLDTTTMNKEIINLIVGVMGYSAEMELSNIRRRTEEGRAVAVSRGVKMGRKRSYSQHQIEEIKAMRRSQRGYGSIAKSLGMSKSTIQRFCVKEGI